jgi:hypothetical protein
VGVLQNPRLLARPRQLHAGRHSNPVRSPELEKYGPPQSGRCLVPARVHRAAGWTGRRITLSAEYVNSLAAVSIDGKSIGTIRFPAGEVDLTGMCEPGRKYTLGLLVTALPLKGVLLSFADTNAAREVKGSVERRGLCGDLWLTSTSAGPRITDVVVNTSVRRDQISVDSAVENLATDRQYELRLQIRQADGSIRREWTSQAFRASDLQKGRIHTDPVAWMPKELWDIHTPGHMYKIRATLALVNGQPLDVFGDVRFGFREFWIDGKDFYLNGTRIFLSAVPLDNAQLGARSASYAGALETMKRLKSFGINFVYTHNYGCEPGSHISFAEILKAADDAGMLVGFSQPHFGHYDWKSKATPDQYARHAEFFVHVAQNHPSVVAYAMSHNATGYDEDMNPDRIDGRHDPRPESWAQNNARLALRAEAIVHELDPGRVIYHHSSGHLGSMHTCNFYLNFAPVQEVSDWFEHWATEGIKPMFTVEYGVPFTWDWTMYRGWYKGVRTFGSARVPWEFCLAEWNAQFLGARAYQISERERQNLRWEAAQFKQGNLWHRWDYPNPVGSRKFDELGEIFARYLTDNWRAFRTWGLSANSPWEHHVFWKRKDGATSGRRDFQVDWDNLQRPGFSPDFSLRQDGAMPTDFAASDWAPTAAGQALLRNNRPLLACIGGQRGAFTAKDHNLRPGETVEKQLIVINNSREPVRGNYSWTFALGKLTLGKAGDFSLRTGEQQRIPLEIKLPSEVKSGSCDLEVVVRFSADDTQKDSFTIDVLPKPDPLPALARRARIAVFDPKGETAKLLKELQVPFRPVDAKSSLAGFEILIIGKDSLTPDRPGPDVMGVLDGLKVIVFEQKAEVLERRFGFRIAEYGLREVFPRVPDHPLLAGLSESHLHDWRGEATVLPPRLKYTLRPRYGPTVQWCGIDVPQVWRCGCRGNVASVLIEKPACGDFLPIVDGGYGLQYSALLEYREGKGMVLFCQMDVTGRTESDPAADTLVRNIIHYASTWQPTPHIKALYAGDQAGGTHFQAAGFALSAYRKNALEPDSLLILGPGGAAQLADDSPAVSGWLQAGGHLLAVGFDEAASKSSLPGLLKTRKEEYISSYFAAAGKDSVFRGIAPADVYNRDPRMIPLVVDAATILGDGILAASKEARVVFCQLVPWHFDPKAQLNLKRTFRCASRQLTRLLANLGAPATTPILSRFARPAESKEQRWLNGLYLDVPEEWDYPYRFFRW